MSSAGEARTAAEACRNAAETLARHDRDIPFALLYLPEADRTRARLVATAGVEPQALNLPVVLALAPAASEQTDEARTWPFAEAREAALMETDRLIDEFLGIASHELRTPLMSITANVQMKVRALRPLVSGDATNDERSADAGRMERAYTILDRTERQVKRHGGQVGLASTPGKGSAFWFTLPLSRTTAGQGLTPDEAVRCASPRTRDGLDNEGK